MTKNKISFVDDNGKPLPKDVQKRVNDFLERVKKVNWFNPSPDLKKKEVDRQVEFMLKCFGVEAEIEYRKLETEEDWVSVRGISVDSGWYSVLCSATDSARASALDSSLALASARTSAWDSTRVATWVSASASAEVLVLDKIKYKYPNGAFIQLFRLWEMGLCPCGVIDGKFVIYSKPIATDLFKK